jgi:hypothetical protein
LNTSSTLGINTLAEDDELDFGWESGLGASLVRLGALSIYLLNAHVTAPTSIVHALAESFGAALESLRTSMHLHDSL